MNIVCWDSVVFNAGLQFHQHSRVSAFVCVCVCANMSIEISNRGSSYANTPIEPVFGPGTWYGLRAHIKGLCANSKKKTRDKLITVMNTARALATGELLCGRLWAVVFAGNNYKIVDFKFQPEFDETATGTASICGPWVNGESYYLLMVWFYFFRCCCVVYWHLTELKWLLDFVIRLCAGMFYIMLIDKSCLFMLPWPINIQLNYLLNWIAQGKNSCLNI